MADPTPLFPVSFYFSLSFSSKGNQNDGAFKEASGIAMDIGTEEVTCGGENRFKYKLPGVASFQNLVLKRGMIPKKSALTSWIDSTLGGGLIKPIQPTTITLKMLGANKSPVVTWTFANAYPVKWSVSDFNSMDNNLSVETLEFAYTYFKRKEN